MLLPPPPPAGPARILVADDVAENRRLLARILARQGHRVDTAENGAETLTKLRAADAGVDLVLLDVEMPEPDGIEVLRKMKADPRLNDVPVVMVSGLDDVDAIARCIELGADDFISKPFDPRLMKARVRSSLDRRRLREWEQTYLRQLEQEEALSERLIMNMLPEAIAKRLKRGETAIAEHFDDVSVLFADIVGFTTRAATTEARSLVAMLNRVFSQFDELARQHGLEKIKTIGDAYMVVGGIPEPRSDHLTSVAELALDMLASARGEHDLALRLGMHCGPAVAGVIGTTKLTYDVWGDTINVASRLESQGVADRIQVSSEVAERLAGDFELSRRGALEVRGRGPMDTFFLERRRA